MYRVGLRASPSLQRWHSVRRCSVAAPPPSQAGVVGEFSSFRRRFAPGQRWRSALPSLDSHLRPPGYTTGSLGGRLLSANAAAGPSAVGTGISPSQDGTASGNKPRPVAALCIGHRVFANGHQWIDVTCGKGAPVDQYRSALAAFLRDNDVHETLVEDSQDPVLLPQTVLTGSTGCLIARLPVADPSITGSDSIATLTHRLTVFVFPNRIITVHRVPLPLVTSIDASFDRKLRGSTLLHLQNVLVKGVCKAYLEELTRCVVRFDSLEARLFSCTYNERTDLAHDLYHVKRRAAVYSRLLGMQHEAYSHLSHSFGVLVSNPHYQDVIQSLVHARTMAEDLNDNAQNVLQLVFQISSYQLNELMRVLTRFSAFFIPLSFITSVWGMNFPDLPLVESEHGLLIWCVGVSIIATFLLLWFKWRAF